jgi:D-glycero-alpha-D-manno-heptose-7-phosphate kinase
MIIVRSPLRITLGGGGTDISSYYKQFEGFLISAAINKYIYATISRPFIPGILLKYSRIESVEKVENIAHPIIKEALKEFDLKSPQLEISTLADIPSGTGLGSSGSFTTALLKALATYYKKSYSVHDLAELACKIEIENLKQPIGKQDQFIASYGGIRTFVFKKNEEVTTELLPISLETLYDLEDNFVLFFTGYTRSASEILLDQTQKSLKSDKEMTENLHYTKELGLKSKDALVSGDTVRFANLLNEHWKYKKNRSKNISNSKIDFYYEQAIKNGAIGGKLVGAGGGGFLLFYCEDKVRVRKSLKEFNLEEIRFKFDFEGTKVLLS